MRVVVVITVSVLALGATSLRAQAQKKTIRESPHKVLKRSCERCHIATSFKDIRYDHSDAQFALDGPHAELGCLDCHSIEDFSKVEATCATCHTDVHQDRMGRDCERCHVIQGWSVFDGEEIHATTNFPLLGRHVMLDCESCHASMSIARFRQTPSQCVDCHREDYNAVTSPSHAGSGFSVECQECHNTVAWVPAWMTDHDAFFPIFSGRHNNVWSQCSDCHTSSANMRVVDCLGCHEHDQTLMDPVHQGMTGYAYNSPACLGCHPRGEAGEFRNHDPLFFPIFSGRHAGEWGSCETCHPTPSNKKVFTCITCHNHDQQTADRQHLGEVQNYVYTETSCYDCHPDGRVRGD